jgi:hypothetical protein
MILGTFSEQGPRKCSGLEIKQYSDATLAARFAASFNKTSCIELDHKTPSGTSQNFLFCRFQKK